LLWVLNLRVADGIGIRVYVQAIEFHLTMDAVCDGAAAAQQVEPISS
jgi:putative component of toxin-antitoxin plasmid stabilization module